MTADCVSIDSGVALRTACSSPEPDQSRQRTLRGKDAAPTSSSIAGGAAAGSTKLEWGMAEDQSTPSFEACLEELERVVQELEAGDLSLERSLELFEKGVNLSETCRKQLEDAETRVEMLTRKESKIQPEPFRPDQT